MYHLIYKFTNLRIHTFINAFIFFSFLSFTAVSQNTPTMSMDTIYATGLQNGAIINMPVQAKNFTDVGSIGLWIKFNANVLTYKGLVNINPLVTGIITSYQDTTIKIAWTDYGDSGVSLQNTTLFKIKFVYNGGNSKVSFYQYMCEASDFLTSKFFSVKYINGLVVRKPFQFDLTAPVNNTIIDSTPAFRWQSSKLAINYKLIIDDTIIKDSISTTSYKFTNSQFLKPGLHNWYVLAYNATDTTKSNETWSLIIDRIPPRNFTLISPLNDSAPQPCNVLFSWHSAEEQCRHIGI